MTVPIRSVLDGEVLPPGDASVTVYLRKHPLLMERVCAQVPAGMSLAEIVALIWPERGDQDVSVCLSSAGAADARFDPETWRKVRPKPGTVVVVEPLLKSGALRSIGLLLVAITALIVAPYLAPGLVTALAGAGITLSAATATSLIAGAITIGGSLIFNALFPVRPPQLSSEQQSSAAPVYSISGAQNQPGNWQTVPVVLGKHRMSPLYGAAPYTEIVGDDQYLRLLFVWGYGPLEISDIRIGDTPLSSFGSYEIETRRGFVTDQPITLYPSSVSEESLQIKIIYSNNSSEWYYRQTAEIIDEFSVDFTAPEGIYKLDSESGEYLDYTVIVNIWFRKVGDPGFSVAGQVYLPFNKTTSRGTFRLKVPRGQYEIVVFKNTPENNNQYVKDTVYWSALRSFRNEHPVAFPKGLAMTALRIRATDQLSGLLNSFNGLVSSYTNQAIGVVPGTWVETNKPADLFRLVLQGPGNARPVPAAKIDVDTLTRWSAFCDANGFRFNQVREKVASVWETLADIAAAGRASLIFVDGKWSVIWDDPNAAIVQHFGTRNTWGFTGSRAYARPPHGWRVRFVNEAKDYSEDERIVYDDGYSAANATLFESIEFPGVTNASLIWKHGRYHIAQVRLRPEKYTFFTDWENVRCTRGDRVRFSHDVIEVGQLTARVKAVDIGAGTVTLDEACTMESGNQYGVRFRLSDGTSLLRSVVFAEGETTVLTLDPDDASAAFPIVGDFAMFGERGSESGVYRVDSIEHQADLVAKLTLIDDAPAIAQADQGAIPAFTPNITDPVDPYKQVPITLTVQEIVDGSGASKTVTVRFSWQARLAKVARFEAQYTTDSAEAKTGWSVAQTVTPPQTAALFPGLLLGTYSFRVRAIFTDHTASNWAVLPASAITGVHLSSPLPAILNARSVYVDNVRQIQWDEVKDFREPFYEIRKGDRAESALTLAVQAHPPFPSLGNGQYWIAAVANPIAGLTVYSPWTGVEIEGALLPTNILASYDEEATGWGGGFFGAIAKVGGIIRTGNADNILDDADVLDDENIVALGGGGSGNYEIPPAHIVDVGRSVGCQVSITLNGGGIRADQNILTEPNILETSDMLDAASSRLVEVYAEIATADNDPTDIYSVPDVYDTESVPDVYGAAYGWAAWEKWTAGVKTARAFKARAVLNSLDDNVYAYATEFTFTVDPPDRRDDILAKVLPSGGEAIVFRPNGASTDAPFNGGPNNSAVPALSLGIRDAEPGDHFANYTGSLSKSGVTLQVLNSSGVGVSRTVDLYAFGY